MSAAHDAPSGSYYCTLEPVDPPTRVAWGEDGLAAIPSVERPLRDKEETLKRFADSGVGVKTASSPEVVARGPKRLLVEASRELRRLLVRRVMVVAACRLFAVLAGVTMFAGSTRRAADDDDDVVEGDAVGAGTEAGAGADKADGAGATGFGAAAAAADVEAAARGGVFVVAALGAEGATYTPDAGAGFGFGQPLRHSRASARLR